MKKVHQPMGVSDLSGESERDRQEKDMQNQTKEGNQ
jgi:hypothetical protein